MLGAAKGRLAISDHTGRSVPKNPTLIGCVEKLPSTALDFLSLHGPRPSLRPTSPTLHSVKLKYIVRFILGII